MNRLRAALAWLLPACGLIASCGWLGLIEPTETRYAEIAREMLASRDWLIPRLNGIPHFAKPPLAYWSAASGMAVLGVNEWGARLGAALAASFVLWCTARMARQAGGALAPAFLVSSVFFFALSHQLASDIFLAAAVAGFYAAILDPRTRASLWLFVALAVGFMAKGPVVLVLTVAPALLAAAWARDASPARALASWRGWLLFVVIALPWYLVVLIRTPGLWTFFFQRQIWERYATTVHQRGGPIYYFLI
ncbi:MAG TPA: phospholipid carrier-dependent glycosyltransferase, partial [Candidatus Binatia bacterium]|nr:phospholipid carrier-dependent glycosyltransferase [Candidatus Binatia bacterium]